MCLNERALVVFDGTCDKRGEMSHSGMVAQVSVSFKLTSMSLPVLTTVGGDLDVRCDTLCTGLDPFVFGLGW